MRELRDENENEVDDFDTIMQVGPSNIAWEESATFMPMPAIYDG